MNDCLVSVIVPIYNVEKYLNKCIESIINQTYKNLEIILIDDGSTDKSGKICDRFEKKDNRIKVIHQKNAGVSSARNTGIDSADGLWIAFIDSDDWVEENYIKNLIENTSKDVDVVQCGYYRIVEEKKEQINCAGKLEIKNADEFLNGCLNPQTAYGLCHMKIIRKSIINDIRFNEKIVVCEDALFNIQISRNMKYFKMIKQPLYNYRINRDSVVRRYDENYPEKYKKALKVIGDYLRINYTNNYKVRTNYFNFVVYHLMLIAVNYCYNPEKTISDRKNTLKKVCKQDLFAKSLKGSNYNNISLTRKITLWTLKNRFYSLTGLICEIRQKQNNC